jgi:hypothetical protein
LKPVGSAAAGKKGAEEQGEGGLRGGHTPIPELEKVTEDVKHMTTSDYKYQPNVSGDISEKYIEGIPSSQAVDTFRVDTVRPISPIWFYIMGIGLSYNLYFLFDYPKVKFPEWIGLKNSSQSASTKQKSPTGVSMAIEGVSLQFYFVYKMDVLAMLIIALHCKTMLV